MTSRYRITLNNVHLDSLDKNIMILDIQHSQPERTFVKQTNANLDGVHISDTYVGQRTVTVTFELHIYDTAKRNEACQKVNAWAAAGGTLRTNERKDQQLVRVVCEQYAEIESAKNWTDPLTLVFSTTDCPYWVSQTAATKSISNKTSGSYNLKVDGNVGSALLSVTATAEESNITNIKFTCGSYKLHLKGIKVAKGEKISVSYTRGRYLKITHSKGNKSIMSFLDQSSSDNLLAVCGQANTVGFAANKKVSVTFTTRGMWL